MSKLVTSDAHTIARKLNAQVEQGRRHLTVKVRCRGIYIGSFNIRRGSGEMGHDFIPQQIQMTMRQAIEMARCRVDADGYAKILEDRGVIPKTDQPAN